MGRLIVFGVIVAAFSAFIGYRIVELQRRTLMTREVQQNHLPNCQLIKGLEHGSEDITILPNGLAIISTGLRYPGLPSFSGVHGKIFMLDLEDERLKPVELRIGRGFDFDSFNPHGISIYTDEKDLSVYLFVVNHPEDNSQVEIFQFVEEENSIVHLRTIKHELLHSVNDIVAVGPDSFYATNDHFFANKLLKQLEMLLLQPWCTVVYYSPEEVKVVADTFYSANGINISPDNKYVYVADFFDYVIKVMEIQENKVLHHVKVIKIQNIHSEKPIVTRVYSDNGSVIEGSSVASSYNGKLLIGSVFHKALCCDVK
ncbi:hypothetical protein SKAU_G00219050 [Synaphobranchus kaupii]|uniref:Paraoxonase n=1 Tax=Synaphobranchus kaupii TaxID=118154 RepID=A0A9Q1FAE7_SYNKA|nr:hypothetical protein SKAU_G00219050 [Synaphobranchus kaupii]